jgi:molecular chaperone DnaK (HSP70)
VTAVSEADAKGSQAARLVIGIDLGTTHTVLAWSPLDAPAEVRVFPIPQLVSSGEVGERPLLPSFLYSPLPDEALSDPLSGADWVPGQYARRRGEEVPARLVASAKSWLCHGAVDRNAAILPWGSREASTPKLSPVEASTRLLAHVKAAWNAAHPSFPLEEQLIVLTVPASFDPVARELTVRAARAAGLEVRLLEEPQAAFYDHLQRTRGAALAPLTSGESSADILVVDVGGGTTDLTLIRATPSGARAEDVELERVAVGRHLLLGGDNMDLALAHLCESRMLRAPERLEPARFAELVLQCRRAKEQLLGEDAPDNVSVSVLGRGAQLFASALTTTLAREEIQSAILDGFFPLAERNAEPKKTRTALVAFGLPYEADPGITRHVASFYARHARGAGPEALLLNGGVFRSPSVRARLASVVESWGGAAPVVLDAGDPELAVARGAVVYGLALAGHGRTIGGGSPRGYYVGLERDGELAALSVVPRGTREGERVVAANRPLALRVGTPVRFELFASDDELVHAPGEVVSFDPERFVRLVPVAARFASARPAGSEVPVWLEGELSALGTLDLGFTEIENGRPGARHHLALELAAPDTPAERSPAGSNAAAPSIPARVSRPPHARLGEAAEAIERAFGKGRADVGPREAKDLLRNLEKLLGERATWTTETARGLFDALLPGHRARKRSVDHERVFWMLAGFCLRPGMGHPRDRERVAALEPLFSEALAFSSEARGWQQFFIAWRRIAAGLSEPAQIAIRDRLDPFLAPEEEKLKKPKGFRPGAPDELLDLCSWLERVPAARRSELGRWLLERTWTDRDPRLWAALGRVGARVPAYASAHHVVPGTIAERWLDHLLREKWEEVPTAVATARELARVTGDRTRDVPERVREEVARRMERLEAPAEWVRSVRELILVEENERASRFGEDLPVGLRLLDESD